MTNYFSVPLFSNSYLTKLYAEISNRELPENDSLVYKIGIEFEDCLLYNKEPKSKMIENMVKEMRGNNVFHSLFSHPNCKIQHEFYGKFMGLPFKAKADMVIKGFVVPDIKTTSCNTYNSFLDSVQRFDYDRQMYIYMEVFRCDYSCLLAVTKSTNPKIFIVPIEKKSFLWESGKRKTEHIISIIKALCH